MKKMINQNRLAKDIAKMEHGKVQVNIAQIKEVMKCTFILLGDYEDAEIIKLINRVALKHCGTWSSE